MRIEGLPKLPPGMVTEGMDIIIRVRSAEEPDAAELPRQSQIARDERLRRPLFQKRLHAFLEVRLRPASRCSFASSASCCSSVLAGEA